MEYECNLQFVLRLGLQIWSQNIRKDSVFLSIVVT